VFSPAPPSAKPKKTKKRVVKDESEDEFAFDDAPTAAPARAARGGGRAKTVNYAAIAGSDSEEDEWANSGDESDGFVDSD